MVTIKIDTTKCTGEGTCVDICPVAVFELQDVDGKKVSVAVSPDQCLICRACEAQCPTSAIEVIE